MTAGARPQEPMQRAVCTLTLPSGVVCPALAQRCSSVCDQAQRAGHVAGGAQADHEGVLALRLQRKEMIEAGDAQDAAGRQAQFVGDGFEQRRRKKAEELLGGVQHFDERVAGVLMARHGALQEFLAVVFHGHTGGLADISGSLLLRQL